MKQKIIEVIIKDTVDLKSQQTLIESALKIAHPSTLNKVKEEFDTTINSSLTLTKS